VTIFSAVRQTLQPNLFLENKNFIKFG